MTSLADRIKALPKWPGDVLVFFHGDEYRDARIAAALARLALAREWIKTHGGPCEDPTCHCDENASALLEALEGTK